MNKSDIKKIVEELIQTFLDAGKVSLDLRKQGLIKEIKSDNTPVSNGDLEVNKILTKKISELTKKNGAKKQSIDKYILSITENGYGKRSSLLDFRVTNRGGKGIIGIVNSKRNGNVTSNLVVSDEDQIILSTDKGRVIRCAVKEIRIAGRNTQGVRIIKLSGEEKVVSAIKIEDNIE